LQLTQRGIDPGLRVQRKRALDLPNEVGRLLIVLHRFGVAWGLLNNLSLDDVDYSGVSTQPDFHRGSARSREGKAIVCLRSTTDDGKQSRIRPHLLAGEGVTLARPDVHYVVTEFGIAYLFGKSVRERATALIEIAHPDFRESLLDEAKRQSLAPSAAFDPVGILNPGRMYAGI